MRLSSIQIGGIQPFSAVGKTSYLAEADQSSNTTVDRQDTAPFFSNLQRKTDKNINYETPSSLTYHHNRHLAWRDHTHTNDVVSDVSGATAAEEEEEEEEVRQIASEDGCRLFRKYYHNSDYNHNLDSACQNKEEADHTAFYYDDDDANDKKDIGVEDKKKCVPRKYGMTTAEAAADILAGKKEIEAKLQILDNRLGIAFATSEAAATATQAAEAVLWEPTTASSGACSPSVALLNARAKEKADASETQAEAQPAASECFETYHHQPSSGDEEGKDGGSTTRLIIKDLQMAQTRTQKSLDWMAAQLQDTMRSNQFLLRENSLLRSRQEERQQLLRDMDQHQQLTFAMQGTHIHQQLQFIIQQQQEILQSLKVFAVCFEIGIKPSSSSTASRAK